MPKSLNAAVGPWNAQVKTVLATYHRDPSEEESYGGDLRTYRAVSGPLGPVVQELAYLDLCASYLFNPNSNLRAYAGFQRRSLTNSSDVQQSSYLYLGIRTLLFNRYYDI